MDYRHSAIDTLTDFAQEQENMSFGEILYSCTRNTLTGLDIKDLTKLTSISDKQWYEIIEKAKKDERE